jgi:hypothetical protein
LSGAVGLERVEPVPGWDLEAVEDSGSIEHDELA